MKSYLVVTTSALLICLNFLVIYGAPRNGNGGGFIKHALLKKLGPKNGLFPRKDQNTKIFEYCSPFFYTDSHAKGFTTCAVSFNIPFDGLEFNPESLSSSLTATVPPELKKKGLDFFEDPAEEFKNIMDSFTNIGKEGTGPHSRHPPSHLPPAVMQKVLENPCFGECIMKNSKMLLENGNVNQTFFADRFMAISNGTMLSNTTSAIIEHCQNRVAASKDEEDPRKDICWTNTRVGMCISRFSWEVCQYFALADSDHEAVKTEGVAP